MAHVTFIHGIENKPPQGELLRQWQQALAVAGGIDLAGLRITTSMVYWADALYSSPLEALAEAALAGSGNVDAGVLEQLLQAADDPEEARFLAGLAGKVSIAALRSAAAAPVSGAGASLEERVPLPWSIKEPLMASLLRDVHHYLFNVSFSPRPGVTYRIRDEIRRRFVDDLMRTSEVPGPHIVVSHSMGTVIAYDCLLRAANCPSVDGLVTIGSPLGLDEIQDKLRPEWSRANGYPEARLHGAWVNVFDPLDPVAGFSPRLASEYQHTGRRAVVDIVESNFGWWRHDIAKYLQGSQLRQALRSLLRLPSVRSAGVEEGVAGAAPRVETPRAGFPKPVLFSEIQRQLTEPVQRSVEESPGGAPTPLFEAVLADNVGAPAERAGAVGRVGEALRLLREDAISQGPNVMSSPSDKVASLLQSAVAMARDRRAARGIEEIPFDKDDTKVVLHDVLKAADNLEPHPQLEPSSSTAEPFPDQAKVFLVSDFGTGLYGAPVISATIAAQHFDLLLHLGDIYYSGQTDEVRRRFLDFWPSAAGDMSRTLNGNHDMYSGGYGYFDVALPAFNQPSSYFALQNEHWLLVCLDTAYKDNNLGKAQCGWLAAVLENVGSRKVLLFSHHPLFSNFKPQGVKLAKKLSTLLDSGRVAAWYWGHEHHAVIYDGHARYGLLGRCLGNGGMPSKRKDILDFPVERAIGPYTWRRAAGGITPPALYLDGANPYITEEAEKYGPHGYMTLILDGPSLTESVFTANGQQLFENVI